MRNYRIVSVVILISVSTWVSAQSVKEVLDPKAKMTWLGLDFTEAKFIGDIEKFEMLNIPNLLTAWNDLMLDEKEKYDIAKMLHRSSVDMDLGVTVGHNAQLKLDDLLTRDTGLTQRLSESDISSIVSKYDFGGKSGNGLMFIVETFSKTDEVAVVWVTFVDMDKKSVLFTRWLKAPPKGFGLRNYWAGAIYSIIKDVQNIQLSKWSKGK